MPISYSCPHCSKQFSVELPDLSEAWQIGVIVGPSGSGKTTVARQAFGTALYAGYPWPADRAVVDCFGERPMKEITHTLTAVGFGSPPAWIVPYHVLSNGEKFRCDLARALLSSRGLLVFDEFTSVVDRTVGCSGQTSAMHLDNFTTQVWTFTGGPPSATDADWVKQEAGTDRRCFTTTRKRENVLLQAKVCQAGNGGPAVNVLAGAMQNTLGQ